MILKRRAGFQVHPPGRVLWASRRCRGERCLHVDGRLASLAEQRFEQGLVEASAHDAVHPQMPRVSLPKVSLPHGRKKVEKRPEARLYDG